MKKGILLHGATNCDSSNYGDFLYIELIYDYITSKGFKTMIWQPSNFFINWIEGYHEEKKKTKLSCETLIYVPGGYFGEGHKARFRDNIIQFLRFMPIGLLFSNSQNKKICVVGIGAGPNHSLILKRAIQRICNRAYFVSARDEVSYSSLCSMCPKAKVYNHFDLIVASKAKYKMHEICKNNAEVFRKAMGKKILLVHFNNNKKALDLFAKTVHIFLKSHKDVYPVVSADNILSNEDELFDEFKGKLGMDCGHFFYSNPHEMTSFLSKVDVVLTSKLHVGVVSCIFNKSVIVAACHPEKTKRFYSQIQESSRCVSLDDTNEKELYRLLTTYFNIPIQIDEKFIQLADESWILMDDYLRSLLS